VKGHACSVSQGESRGEGVDVVEELTIALKGIGIGRVGRIDERSIDLCPPEPIIVVVVVAHGIFDAFFDHLLNDLLDQITDKFPSASD
jgi:hypothetical protein